MLTSAQLTILKNEISNDPLSLAYANKTDEEQASIVSTTVRNVDRETFDGGLVATCLVVTEYASLTSAAVRQWVDVICGAVNIPFTQSLKDQILNVFTQQAAPQTRANIIAIAKRSGFRSEELGLPIVVTASDVADAKRT